MVLDCFQKVPSYIDIYYLSSYRLRYPVGVKTNEFEYASCDISRDISWNFIAVSENIIKKKNYQLLKMLPKQVSREEAPYGLQHKPQELGFRVL